MHSSLKWSKSILTLQFLLDIVKIIETFCIIGLLIAEVMLGPMCAVCGSFVVVLPPHLGVFYTIAALKKRVFCFVLPCCFTYYFGDVLNK